MKKPDFSKLVPFSDEWTALFISLDDVDLKNEMIQEALSRTAKPPAKKRRQKSKTVPKDPYWHASFPTIISQEAITKYHDMRNPQDPPLVLICPNCLLKVEWGEYQINGKKYRCPECGFTCSLRTSHTCGHSDKAPAGKCYKRHVPIEPSLEFPRDWYKHHPLPEVSIKNNIISPIFLKKGGFNYE